MTAAASVAPLAVLLEVGLTPLDAWRHLGETEEVASRIAETDGPERLPDAILAATRGHPDAVGWACVAAAWRVAADSGAPLAATLARLADVLVAADDARREIEIALAGPLATRRIVLLAAARTPRRDAPGCRHARGAGDDAARLVLPGRRECAARGRQALDVAPRCPGAGRRPGPRPRRRTRRDRRRRRRIPPAALDRAAAALKAAGLPPDCSPADVVGFARRAGVPIATLLRAEAREARRDAHAAVRIRMAPGCCCRSARASSPPSSPSASRRCCSR